MRPGRFGQYRSDGREEAWPKCPYQYSLDGWIFPQVFSGLTTTGQKITAFGHFVPKAGLSLCETVDKIDFRPLFAVKQRRQADGELSRLKNAIREKERIAYQQAVAYQQPITGQNAAAESRTMAANVDLSFPFGFGCIFALGICALWGKNPPVLKAMSVPVTEFTYQGDLKGFNAKQW